MTLQFATHQADRRPCDCHSPRGSFAASSSSASCVHQTTVTETIAPSPPPKPNELSAVEAATGWQLLFDGHTLKGWHGLGFAETPAGLWSVVDGAIQHAAKDKSPVQADGQPLAGFDLISDSVYKDFELSWEWKISVAGNSGLKYNVDEKLSTSMSPPHAAKGWEYQMNDDALNEDNKLATHRSGALYDMLPANEKKHVNPAGQWNRSPTRLSRQPRRALAQRREDRRVRLRHRAVRLGVRQEQVCEVSRLVPNAPGRRHRSPGPQRRRIVQGHQDSSELWRSEIVRMRDRHAPA